MIEGGTDQQQQQQQQQQQPQQQPQSVPSNGIHIHKRTSSPPVQEKQEKLASRIAVVGGAVKSALDLVGREAVESILAVAGAVQKSVTETSLTAQKALISTSIAAASVVEAAYETFIRPVARAAAEAVLRETTPPPEKQRTVISVGPVEIQPGASETLSVTPQCFFWGEKVINTGSDKFNIQAIFVGSKNQLPAPMQSVHAAAFGTAVQGNDITMDQCKPWMAITVIVKNFSSTPETFSMAFVGQSTPD